MNLNNVKLNMFIFICSYILFISIYSMISYKFIISDSLKLEKNQNQNNVMTILNSMNTNINNISKITADYSNWDDTYDFMIDSNKEYISENFREGTSTLEDLDVNFFIFLNTKDKVLFSTYTSDFLEKNSKNFENHLLTKFNKKISMNTIMKYKSYFMYLIKSEILRSDATGEVRGWIYSGKIITNENLNKVSKVFKSLKLSKTFLSKYDSKISLSQLNNIKLKTNLLDTNLINTIQFYDNTNSHIFSIITDNYREIISNSEKTIFIFNTIIAFFVFIISLIIYNNQNMLLKYNKLLELKVNRRTNQLSRSLRKLQTTNKKLYSLANIDTLTKIRNRRSYFIESESLLKKAISEDKNFYVLMIDIDHFKKVNDTYGHAIGDKVLIDFCTIINSILRDEIFGRIGGEEFCVTFYDKDEEFVNNLSEKIRSTCENSVITSKEDKINFTVSLGLSSRANFTNIDDILCISDELLYKAKSGGRNRLVRSLPH